MTRFPSGPLVHSVGAARHTASGDHTAKHWNTDSSECLRSLSGHASGMNSGFNAILGLFLAGYIISLSTAHGHPLMRAPFLICVCRCFIKELCTCRDQALQARLQTMHKREELDACSSLQTSRREGAGGLE